MAQINHQQRKSNQFRSGIKVCSGNINFVGMLQHEICMNFPWYNQTGKKKRSHKRIRSLKPVMHEIIASLEHTRTGKKSFDILIILTGTHDAYQIFSRITIVVRRQRCTRFQCCGCSFAERRNFRRICVIRRFVARGADGRSN